MAIKQRTITEYYCDACNAMCHDMKLFTMPTYLTNIGSSKTNFHMVFRFSNTMQDGKQDCLICNECQKEYLKSYLEELEK